MAQPNDDEYSYYDYYYDEEDFVPIAAGGGGAVPNRPPMQGGQPMYKQPQRNMPSMAAPPPMGGGFKPPNRGVPSMAAPPPRNGGGGGFKPPNRGVPSMAAPPPMGGGFKPPNRGVPSMAAPPPMGGGFKPPNRGVPSMAAPPPMGGGFKPPNKGVPSMAAPPPMGGGFKPPAAGFSPTRRAPTVPQRNPNMGMNQPPAGDDGEYDYEYEYEEEYEYEYDDEDAQDGHGMARPKNDGMQVPPRGGGMGQNPMAMINPTALKSQRDNLDAAPAPQPKVYTQNRPFGLTSTKIQQMRGNMNRVEKNYEKQPVQQRDFRGNLQSTVVATNKPAVGSVIPKWTNPNLRPGARPMTTMINNPAEITSSGKSNKSRVDRTEERSNKANTGPKWLNGVLVGDAPIVTNRRIRPRDPSAMKRNGRISAKIAVQRKQDPKNPNKFLTKNRVSYRIKKTSAGNKPAPRPPMDRNNFSYRIQQTDKNGARRIKGGFAGSKPAPTPPSNRDFSYRIQQTNQGGAKRIKGGFGGGSPSPTPPVNREFSYRVKQTDMQGAKKVSRRSANPDKARDPNRVSRRRRTHDPNKARDPNRVSRRHRRPNVNRTSANYNIFGAKTQTTDEQGVGKGDGCYLRFDSGNGGVLYAQWTTIGFESGDALAYFKPKTPVPRFNYRRNEGRIDLLSKTKNDFRQYAEAWTYFLALAREHEGMISVLGQSSKREFSLDLYGLSGNMQVSMLRTSRDIDCTQWVCIACVPSGSNLFNGLNSAQPAFFMDNAAKEGFAVRLKE